MPTDPNPPVTPVDTSGVTGATGPLPAGTAPAAANADTTVYGGGGGTDLQDTLVAGTVETTGAVGGTGAVASTALAGTLDSVQGGGGVRLDKDQAYRAPSGPVAASNSDSTRTDAPVTGMVLVTNKAYNATTDVATLLLSGAAPAVGTLIYVYGVDADLNGPQTVTYSAAGEIRFTTAKPASNISSTAVVGGYITTSQYSTMSGTLESTNVGAVPVTNTNVPAAPTAVSAVANNDGTVTVSWTPPTPISGAPTRGFLIESSRGLTHWAPANATSYVTDLWALEADVAVTFTVAARNDNGLGARSSASGSVTPKNINFLASSPDAAVNPVYGPSGNQDFNLVGVQNRAGINYTWTLPPTNVAYSAVTLKVFNAATGVQVGSDYVLGGSATSQAVTGLTYGNSYYATVSATNANGTVTSDRSTTALALLVPAAPAAPTGVNATGGNATITYADPSDTGGSAITSHVIQWSSDNFVTVAGSTTDAVSPATAAAGVGTWKFRVAAVNAVGTGAFSAASANVTVT
jgi:titin